MNEREGEERGGRERTGGTYFDKWMGVYYRQIMVMSRLSTVQLWIYYVYNSDIV